MTLDMHLFYLTIEQQFQLKIIEDSVEQMSQAQLKELLIQSSRLLMIKDNAIKDLLKNGAFSDFK